jgi:SAM-dependent methyltransferase
LKKDSKVIELGCGIGTLSELILKYIKKGIFFGNDISPESIAYAKSRFSKYSNAKFEAFDVAHKIPSDTYDFIILADVLEHIPIDAHDDLFSAFSRISHSNTKLIINIPHPRLIEYQYKYEKELLQIIDQALPFHHIMNLAGKHGFELLHFSNNKVFREPFDYQFIVFGRLDNEISIRSFSNNKIIFRKFLLKLKYRLNMI